MSGEPLILTIELQLCLVMASTLNDIRNAAKATATQGDGITRVARPARALQPPASMPAGLCAASSPIRESTVPARRARIVL